MENFDKTKIRLLAFDIDGTIFSSEEIILPVYKEAIANYIKKSNIKIPVPTQERIMLEIGKPVKTIFKNLLPELPEPERDKISDDVLRLLCEKIRNGEGHVYPNVFESVKSLREKGFSIA
ncbi:MAG: HAD hydrolase-like protein, partial [Leptospira sp.]|nr:HAD hydrolase-like protein [Leptospira sp.]